MNNESGGLVIYSIRPYAYLDEFIITIVRCN